jgi:hypothetical protein
LCTDLGFLGKFSGYCTDFKEEIKVTV